MEILCRLFDIVSRTNSAIVKEVTSMLAARKTKLTDNTIEEILFRMTEKYGRSCTRQVIKNSISKAMISFLNAVLREIDIERAAAIAKLGAPENIRAGEIERLEAFYEEKKKRLARLEGAWEIKLARV